MAGVTDSQVGASVINVSLAGSDGTRGGGGGFTTTSIDLQTVIETHLPATLEELQAEVAERVGVDALDYADTDFVTCLLHLADFETGARANEEHAASLGRGMADILDSPELAAILDEEA